MITPRVQENWRATNRGGLLGVAYFLFGYAQMQIGWDVTAVLDPDNLKILITGIVASYAGTGGIASYYRDKPAPWQPEENRTVVVQPGQVTPPSAPVVVPADVPPPIAAPAGRIDMSLLRKELIRDEGYRDHIYRDSEGNLTAGIGHLIKRTDPEYGKPEGTKIPAVRINQWFESDLSDAIDDAKHVVPSFDTHPQLVQHNLVNMAFNLGRQRLSDFKNTLALIESRNYIAAADEALDSKWAVQVGPRATRIAQQFRLSASDVLLS